MDSVLVFKTSVETKWETEQLRPVLDSLMHKGERWNFDLEDCDRILRVESIHLKPETVITALTPLGVNCEELAD